jgi:hypothetical protein
MVRLISLFGITGDPATIHSRRSLGTNKDRRIPVLAVQWQDLPVSAEKGKRTPA